MQNYYHILGVASDATEPQIRRAYLQLCKQYHPDKNNGADWAQERLKVINEAYELLSDPMRRLHYNKALRQQEAEKAAQAQARQRHMKTTAPRVDLTDVVEKSSFLIKPFLVMALALVFFTLAVLYFDTNTDKGSGSTTTSYSQQAYDSERNRFLKFCKEHPRVLTRQEFNKVLGQPIEPGFTYLLKRLLVQGDTSDIHYLIESRFQDKAVKLVKETE